MRPAAARLAHGPRRAGIGDERAQRARHRFRADRRRRAVRSRRGPPSPAARRPARATTGRPAAIASSAARQDSSEPAAISAKHVERVEHRGQVAVAIAGEDDARRPGPIAHEAPRGASARSPLPTSRSRASGNSPSRSAKPRISSSWPRLAARRATEPITGADGEPELLAHVLGRRRPWRSARRPRRRRRGRARAAPGPRRGSAPRSRRSPRPRRRCAGRARARASGATPSARCETSARGRRAAAARAGRASDRGSDGVDDVHALGAHEAPAGARTSRRSPRGSTRASSDKPGTGAMPGLARLVLEAVPGNQRRAGPDGRAPRARERAGSTGSALPVHQRLATRCSTTSGRAAFMRRAAASAAARRGARRRAGAAG